MANRRWVQTLNRSLQFLKGLTPHPVPQSFVPTSKYTLQSALIPKYLSRIFNSNVSNAHSGVFFRHFSSNNKNDDTDEEEEDDDDESEGDGRESADDEWGNAATALSTEDKANEAAEIGYKVIGPLQKSDRVFKPYEPVFAVVQIGSHQFKVSNGDCIYAEKLKCCNVNDKLILNKVLMLGSQTQTIIGRPILPDAAVHAVVEEHALDAKVIIFKKKRRKNYRRKNGHRQELTRLRITDILGIEKPEHMPSLKTEKKEKMPSLKTKKTEKIPAAA